MKESGNSVEQLNAIRFMFKEGDSASNLYIRLQNVSGERCTSRVSVLKGLTV